MTDRELLEAMYQDMQSMKTDMHSIKDEMQSMKGEMQSMKADIQSLQKETKIVKDDVESLNMSLNIVKDKVVRMEMTLENETNHNIQLLAENHISIVDKLNAAIRVQDKSTLYEVEISGLKLKLEKLEDEIKEIKTKIA